MKRLLIAAGLALAATAVHAQNPPPSAPPTSQEEAEAAASVAGHSTTVYHGPHRYPMTSRGRAPGDPRIIDHSMDTLVVEPTRSTITIANPVVIQQPPGQ